MKGKLLKRKGKETGEHDKERNDRNGGERGRRSEEKVHRNREEGTKVKS